MSLAWWADGLVRASIQGSLAIGGVWLVVRCLKTIPLATQVWLWRLALLKFPLALFVPLPVTYPRLSSAIGFSVAPSPAAEPWPQVVVAISLVGFGLTLSCLARELMLARRIKESSHRLAPAADWLSLAARVGVRSDTPVRVSTSIDRPMLLGSIRPVVILPSEQSCGRDAVPMILAHELAHVRRRDLLWNWLPALVETLFFFHPLVWLGRRELRLAQEAECDRIAIEATSASTSEYGRMLLHAATSKGQPDLASVAAIGMAGSYRSIRRRLEMLDRPRMHRSAGVLALLLILPALLALKAKPVDPFVKPEDQLPKSPAFGLPHPRFEPQVPVAQNHLTRRIDK